ncbi:Cyclin-dependent kinase E-1 [Colletotrichum tanaceti]|nr:Cyclin-dependent kinase E-1 [Colletotrichum tanaceti]
MSGTVTDSDSAGNITGDQSIIDTTTPPSTPPLQSLEPELGSASPGQRCLSSPQTWPKDYRTTASFETRKQVIEEPDEALIIVTQQFKARSTSPTIHYPDTPVFGIRDASKANDFALQDADQRLSPEPAITIVSDGGNQQYQKTKTQRPVHQDKPGDTRPTLGSSTPISNISVSPSGLFPRRTTPCSEAKYGLQIALQGAKQRMEDPMNNGRQKYFLPKKQLEGIINEESVARELAERRQCSNVGDARLRKLARATCADQEVDLGGGKKRIRSFRSVFAILVLIDRSDSIELFMEEDVSDLDLPLRIRDDDPETPGWLRLYRRSSDGSPHDLPLLCSSQWSPGQKRHFSEQQWIVLAPFFSLSAYNHVNHYPLKDEHLVPFVKGPCRRPDDPERSFDNDNGEPRDQKAEEGGTSQVYVVWMHPEHHGFRRDNRHNLDPDRGFAVKRLNRKDRSQFDQEVEMLQKFAGDGFHPHVVSVLATYEQFGTFHLIFNRADGDLFHYWKVLCRTPVFNYDTVLWASKQLAGLASGLLRFHKHFTYPKNFSMKPAGAARNDHSGASVHPVLEPSDRDRVRLSHKPSQPIWLYEEGIHHTHQLERFGRHGDLKPENILLFPDVGDDPRGILKITDFGQAELHSATSKTYHRSKGFDTLTYRPPEIDTPPQFIRQSSDIWLLGCIFLEFLTWMLGGAEYLEEFTNRRKAFDPYVYA